MKLRGRPAGVSEDAILDAARDVFLRRGLDATTAEIAERAGVSESLIFYRYKTKEALFVAVIDKMIVLAPSLASLPERVGIGDITDHLYEVGVGIVEGMRTVLPLMMMAWSSAAKMTTLTDRMQHPNPVHIQALKLLGGYFEAEARLGRLRAVDSEILARTFFGGICDYVMSQFLHKTADTLPLAASSISSSKAYALVTTIRYRFLRVRPIGSFGPAVAPSVRRGARSCHS
jgi:AcrR family transcriptional regulator